MIGPAGPGGLAMERRPLMGRTPPARRALRGALVAALLCALAAGRALLRARHGKLSASLAVLRLAPAAFKAQSAWVRLQLRRRPSPNRPARGVPRGAIWLHYCRA